MIPVGTGTVTGATPGVVESPAPMGLELPVTHEFTISGPNASGTQPLYDVELKDDGRAVGASIGLYPYIPSRPQVYHLGAAGAVQQEPGLPQYTADSFGFSGDLITAYSANHGVRIDLLQDNAAPRKIAEKGIERGVIVVPGDVQRAERGQHA